MKKHNPFAESPPQQHTSFSAPSNDHHKSPYDTIFITTKPYQTETNQFFLFLINFIQIWSLFSLILTYLMIDGESTVEWMDVQAIRLWFGDQNMIFGVVGCMGFKIVIISVVVGNFNFKVRDSNLLLYASFTNQIWLKMRYLVELQFQISGLLMLTADSLSLVNFLFSIVMSVFSMVFLQNYSFFKDLFYCRSMFYLSLIRGSMILGFLTNWIFLNMSDFKMAANCFLIGHLHLSLLMIVMYFKKGYHTYKNQKLRWLLVNFIILYFSLTTTLLFSNLAITQSFTITSFLISLILTHITIFLFIYSQLNAWKLAFINGQVNDLQIQEFFLMMLLEQSHFCIDQRSVISGLLRRHRLDSCGNLNCFINHIQVYDSKKRKECRAEETVLQRISLLKFYIKCRYEEFIAKSPQNYEIIIKFMQFIFLKFRNTTLSLKLLPKIKKQSLTLTQKLRLFRLLSIIKEQSDRLAGELYSSKLDLQHLIRCEVVHGSINCETALLLEEKMMILGYLEGEEIDLSLLKRMIVGVSVRSGEILERWKEISEYLDWNRRWKFQYYCFVFYIRNQKIKNKNMAQFQEKQNIISKDQYLAQQFDKTGNSINPRILFADSLCSIHTIFSQNNLIIKNVSKNFSALFGYSLQQILNSPIDKLIPQTISKHHTNIVKTWSQTGRSCSQQQYRISQVYVLDSDQYLLPCYKFPKQYVTVDGEVQYVCLLLRNMRRNYSLICNQRWEIENVSRDVVEVLGIDEEEGKYFRHISLLAMVPCLFQGRWGELEGEVGEGRSVDFKQFVEIDFRSFGEETDLSHPPKSYKNHKILDFCSKTLQFYYCHNVSTCAQFYQSSSSQSHTPIQFISLIRQTHKQLKMDHKSFKCRAAIQKIQIQGSVYYQVVLDKIQLPVKEAVEEEEDVESLHSLLYRKSDNFQRHFQEKMQGGLNLGPASNIFIKEDDDLPPKQNYYLSLLSISLKFLFILLSSIGFLKMSLMDSNYSNIQQKALLTNNTIFMFKIPYVLANYYFTSILNLSDDPILLKQRINDLTNSIQGIFNSQLMRRAIFNGTFNPAKMYWPLNNITGSVGYNQIDLIYLMESAMRTLAESNVINASSKEFVTFTNFLYPAFCNLVNSTKISLHKHFINYFTGLHTADTIIYSLHSIAFLITILLIILLSHKFFGSMLAVMQLHCHFSGGEMLAIRKYLMELQYLFRTLKPKKLELTKNQEKTLSGITHIKKFFAKHINIEEKSIKNKNDQNVNLNKKNKSISIGKSTTLQRRSYYIKLMLGFLLLLCLTMGNNFYLTTLLPPLIQLQTDGFIMMKNYPTGTITGYVITQKYYSTLTNTKFNSSYLAPVLSNMLTAKNKAYIGIPYSNMPFYVKSKLYYYGNVCEIDRELIVGSGINISVCQKIANHSFPRGVASYLAYQYSQVNKIIKLNQSLSFAETKEFMDSLEISNVLNDNFLKIYAQNLVDLSENCRNTANILTGVIIALGFVAVLLIESHMLSALRKQYTFCCEFYMGVMPEWIVREQKIIKSKLKVANFLTD